MLECQSCLVQCLRAIVGEARPGIRAGFRTAQNSRCRITPPPSAQALPEWRRHYSSTKRGGDGKNGDSNGISAPPPKASSHTRDASNKRSRPGAGSSSKDLDRQRWTRPKRDDDDDVLDKEEKDAASENTKDASSISPEVARAVKKELQYLKDPLKHSDHVRHILRSNEIDKALELCREGSKTMQLIVSWNHCIDWLLARKFPKRAIKIYNEMKKRAQFPDSHTYVILLRGLANPPVHSDSVGKALTLYHSLSAPNSRVVQNIMHTNAALQVCARGHSMDSLWGIASRIPENGPAAANNLTFTIILNAIRETATLDAGPGPDQDDIAAMRQRAVMDGRRIWGDIVGKWRKGDLIVDEELVCAMGRLLLIGYRPRDWDDVLNLVEQTMNIPRLVPALGSDGRSAEHLPKPPQALDDSTEPVTPEGEVLLDEFDKRLARPSMGGAANYVKPGNNSLSLIFESLLLTQDGKAATNYWDILTANDGYKVKPDLNNLVALLRVLRQSRQSAKTVSVMRSVVDAKKLQLAPKCFTIALSACIRDKNNPSSFEHATELIKMMQKALKTIGVQQASYYLSAALASRDGKKIASAITLLGPTVEDCKSRVNYGTDNGVPLTRESKQHMLDLVRDVIGSIDQLIRKNMIPDTEVTPWAQRRSKLAAWSTRHENKQQARAASAEDGRGGASQETREPYVPAGTKKHHLKSLRGNFRKPRAADDKGGAFWRNKGDKAKRSAAYDTGFPSLAGDLPSSSRF